MCVVYVCVSPILAISFNVPGHFLTMPPSSLNCTITAVPSYQTVLHKAKREQTFKSTDQIKPMPRVESFQRF